MVIGAATVRISPSNRVRCGRGCRQEFRRQVCRFAVIARAPVRVHRLEPRNPPLHRLWQIVIGGLHGDKFGVAAAARRDHDAGLEDAEIRETHRVHEHAGAAIIRARKPALQ